MSSGNASASQIAAAYAACERLAREHYENFPVASLLLPRRMRRHIAAVYAFARIADDFADEDDRPPAERQHLLDDWAERLHGAAGRVEPRAPDVGRRIVRRSHVRGEGGTSDLEPPTSDFGLRTSDLYDQLFLAVGNTIRECRLPVGLFEDLLAAFRQDTVKTRYETFDELLAYCRCSANPVGRLVLGIAGYEREEMLLRSDDVCTALQLTNFWQDLGRDWHRGRLYVPLSELRAAGADEEDLNGGVITAPWRAVLSSLVARTRNLFERGRSVADVARGRLALELRLTWLGGVRILDKVERRGYDVVAHRPTLGKGDVPSILWQTITWGGR